jgi:hypothetical protein
MTTHKSLYSALAAAQAEMGPALRDAKNPHFGNKYADLASVMAACMPALNKHGIAVLQTTTDDENGFYVQTIFVHGETGETKESRLKLIIEKNNMQGLGSAITYARRYGLMGMAGIAPDDDDGNAAAAAPPKQEKATPAPRISSAQMKKMLPVLDTELGDCFSTVALDRLEKAWTAGMDKDGWPNPSPDSDEYEFSFRRQVKDKFADRRREIELNATPLTEPNILMAGE